MLYGIKRSHWQIILAICRKNADLFDWIKLFGSRARNEGRPSSDVDLAVDGDYDSLTKLTVDFEDSSLPYTFDIIDYRRQKTTP